ncbi:metallophosphatase domain-containing protein [Pedobacter sp. SAFR-022]|uniref:metallophosphatase domain-containing protein n=1 Tax=Pedobacter sp. SAFR-022 TaxID=3436861 RepID=UPI003F7D4A9E
MKFLCLSDTHGKHRLLKSLPQADVIIHAGDLSKDGTERSCMDFMNWYSKLDYEHKIFIAGNHDFFFEEASAQYISKVLPENLVYLNDSGITINGINIWGSPVTPRFFDWAFNRDRGRVINKHWKHIPAITDILVTHGPPMGILDRVGLNDHVGCADLLRHVKRIKPKFHVFGHIHGSYGRWNRPNTQYINASVVDDSYDVKNVPLGFSL